MVWLCETESADILLRLQRVRAKAVLAHSSRRNQENEQHYC